MTRGIRRTTDRSRALLTERVRSIPDAVRAALSDSRPAAARQQFGAPGPVSIVGAGGSAGPARMLAACLPNARVVPPSQMLLSDPPDGRMVVISQGLSPNARLALSRARGRTMLITAADETPADADVVLRHGPETENGMLVRVVGPVLASLASIRFADVALEEELGALPKRIEQASCEVPSDFDHIAFVTAGDYLDLCHGLRWKILETLGYGDAPIYDVLQFAHGPFQQLFDRRVLLIVVDRGTAAERRLYDRLGAMVAQAAQHTIVRLTSSLLFPLCWFEHDAQLNQLVLELLRRSPRDLIDWRGKGLDDQLYGLDHDWDALTTEGTQR